MLSANDTLLRYDNPISICKITDMKAPKKNIKRTSTSPIFDSLLAPSSPPISAKRRQSDDARAHPTEDILDSILPPREWSENSQLWVQHVSSTPATRLEVVGIQEELDRRLKQRQARETGICPVRRELYSQCFDEVIRQVTINCAERGLLLVRIRDEILMTLTAYQTLYESSIAFGMRKALQSEQGKSDMLQRIENLMAERNDLEKQLNEERAKYDKTEKRHQEQKMLEDKKYADEIQFLKKTNQQLKAQLEGIIAPRK